MSSLKHLVAIWAIAVAGQSFAGDKNPYPDTQIEWISTTSSCVSLLPEEVLNLQYRTKERARILCEQARILDEWNIWTILSDYNRDNTISDDDVWIIPGKQLAHLLGNIESIFQQHNREAELYKNLAWILTQWGYSMGDISKKTEFVQKIREHYRGIPAFQNGIETIIQSGIPLEYAIYYGKSAEKKWKEARNTLCSDEDIGQIYCMIQNDISQFPSQLDAMRKDGRITEEEYRIRKIDLEKIIRDWSLEQNIFKEILGLIPRLGGMFVAWNYPLFYRTGNSMPLDKNMLQSRLSLGVWVNNGDNNLDKWGFVQWGINVRLWLNENGEFQISAWAFRWTTLTLPSLQLTYRKMKGFEAIKDSPIPDISKTLVSNEISGGFSFFGPNLRFEQKVHRPETIPVKVEYFSTLLSKILIFRPNDSLTDYMEYLSEKFEATPQLSYLLPMLPNIATKLESMGYDATSEENTTKLLDTLKKSLISEFYVYAVHSWLTEVHHDITGVEISIKPHPTLSISWVTKATHPVLSDEIRREAVTRNNLIPTFQKTLSKVELVSWFSSLSPDISVGEKDGIISIQSRVENEELLTVLEKSWITFKYVPWSVLYNFDGKILAFGNIEKIGYHRIYRTMGEGSEILLWEWWSKKFHPLEVKKEVTQLSPFDTTQVYQWTSIISGKPNLLKKEVGL